MTNILDTETQPSSLYSANYFTTDKRCLWPGPDVPTRQWLTSADLESIDI